MTTKGLLDGIRVLDFTTMMAGPYCTRQLADLGAEVIKIEAPGGEQNRRAAPIRDGESAVYGHLNCGKHSLAIDLKSSDDPRFRTHPDRNRHYAELMALVEGWTSTRSADECERVLMAGKVPCARYRAVEELFDDPQLTHRGAFATVSDAAGTYRVPNPPFAFDNAPAGARDWIAPFGSSAPNVLESLLDMDGDTVADLFHRGVLFRQDD